MAVFRFLLYFLIAENTSGSYDVNFLYKRILTCIVLALSAIVTIGDRKATFQQIEEGFLVKKNIKMFTYTLSFTAAMIAALSLTGCGSSEKEAVVDTAAVVAATDQIALPESVSLYCQARANVEAATIAISKLDSDLSTGTIDQAAYDEQKAAYEQTIADSQAEADKQKSSFPEYKPEDGWVDVNRSDTLEARLAEVTAATETVAPEMETVKADFTAGNISEDEFIEKWTTLEARQYLFTSQTSWLESYLKMLSWNE